MHRHRRSPGGVNFPVGLKRAHDLNAEVQVHRKVTPRGLVIEKHIVPIGAQARLSPQKLLHLIERRPSGSSEAGDLGLVRSGPVRPRVRQTGWTCYLEPMDRSNGYEQVAAEFLAGRGSARSAGVGAKTVRNWARTLAPGAAVIDLGCGPGFPITAVLIDESLHVYGVDAAPTLVQAFRCNFPNTPVVCEAVEDSTFFGRMFDGVVAWGLIFLLSPEEQRRLLQRVAGILVPGGRFLFTSCVEPLVWNDAMTGLESRSIGAEEYLRQLAVAGLALASEYDDEGQNHYFDTFKPDTNEPAPMASFHSRS